MIMESPPGLRLGDTQVHQRQHLTKIIGNRTIEGLHHGSASRADRQACGAAAGQQLPMRQFHDQFL